MNPSSQAAQVPSLSVVGLPSDARKSAGWILISLLATAFGRSIEVMEWNETKATGTPAWQSRSSPLRF